jgi:hypothetical protein
MIGKEGRIEEEEQKMGKGREVGREGRGEERAGDRRE